MMERSRFAPFVLFAPLLAELYIGSCGGQRELSLRLADSTDRLPD